MEIKLDLRDKRLLYELDLNSRQSYSELAKKLKLSKNAVIYRINNLQKAGIIKQFHTAIDIGKLGYISFRLNLKLQNTTPEKEQEIIDFLKKKDEIAWIVSVEGKYNISSLILTKTIKEMNSIYEELLSKYINYIDWRLLTIMTEVSYYSRPFLIDKKENTYEIKFINMPEEIKIDETDKEILKLMAPNSRIQIIEISEKLKLTPKTVISRIRNLEDKKVIIGYRTLFDYEKIGYQYVKFHLNLHNVSETKKKEFSYYVKSHPNIIFNDKVLGGDDIEIEMNVKMPEQLREIIDQIKEKFAGMIKDYYTVQYYKEHKFLFLPVHI